MPLPPTASSTAIVEHRDATVLAAIREGGVLSMDRIRPKMPAEAWPTPQAQDDALIAALTRLRLKKRIVLDVKAGGWRVCA